MQVHCRCSLIAGLPDPLCQGRSGRGIAVLVGGFWLWPGEGWTDMTGHGWLAGWLAGWLHPSL